MVGLSGDGGHRIGIFGGTFDPPHLGHLILASEVRYQLKLDRLLWVLTPLPPHKPGQLITPLPVRLALVNAAISDSPEFELSTVEIDRPPPHYSVDTVRLLRQRYPNDHLVYLMGGDSLRELPRWREPQAFLRELDGIGVMRRPEDEIDLDTLEMGLPGIVSSVQIVHAPLLDIASHNIRERVQRGAPYRFYVHPAVYEIIERENLYRG